jgi:hypothetical protein
MLPQPQLGPPGASAIADDERPNSAILIIVFFMIDLRGKNILLFITNHDDMTTASKVASLDLGFF